MSYLDEVNRISEDKVRADNIETQEAEALAPSFSEQALAAANTNIVGFNKFSNMVANKHMMYDNTGDAEYHKSEEFKAKTQGLPVEDVLELMDAKNPQYLDQRIANQKRYNRDINILDESGAGGIALELGASLFDPVSWLAGGMVLKGFKTLEMATKVQGKALTALNLTAGATTGAVAGGISEASIQSLAGVNDPKRLENVIAYSAALGLGLPLVVKGLQGSASAYKAVANAASRGTQDNSFIGKFSVSTAEQMRSNSTSDFVKDLGDKAVTPARAHTDADGNYIVASNDTAMDVRQDVVEGSVLNIEKNIHQRAKANGLSNADQAQVDGQEWAKFTNQIEQDVRMKMNKMSDEEIYSIYETQTGKKVDDSTEDLYDIVGSSLSKEGFDSGRYRAPKDLDYIGKFYGDFGARASKIELGGIAGKDSRGYGHIKYNQQFILGDVAGAEAKFADMLRTDNLNKRLIASGEITEADIVEMSQRLVEKALDRDMTNKYLSKGNEGATSATKRRKLRLNRGLHPDMFVNDISIIANEYADNIGGKIAMKEVYGLQADKSGSILGAMDKVYKQIAVEGKKNGATDRAIKKDVDNTKAVFETVLGTRKFAKEGGAQTVGRLGKKAANALYSAGFVKYGLVEPWVAVSRFGVGNTIKAMVPAIRQMKERIKTVDSKDPLVNMITHAGLSAQTMRGIRYDRYDNNEIAPTSGRTEMFLDKASHYSRKYSGFNYVNDISDMISGGAAMNDLFAIGAKATLTKSEASRLARYGLSGEEAKKIVSNRAIRRDSSGKITDYNFAEWTNQDLAKKTKRYLQRAVTDTILRSDGTRVHRWQSDVNNPFLNMGLQYTQMPTALYERLIYNGMDEASSRTAVGIIGATVSMYAIIDLENDIAKATGGKVKTEEEMLALAISRIPFVGILPNIYDVVASITGNPTSGGYTSREAGSFLGASMGVANKVLKATQGVADGVGSKDVENFSKLVPLVNSMFLVKNAYGMITKD